MNKLVKQLWFFAIVIGLGLAGCVTGIPVKVKKVALKQPILISDSTKLAPIKFDKIAANIKRGTVIGIYNYSMSGCYPFHENIYWNQGRVKIDNIDFADAFFDQLSAVNFNVIGNSKKLFSSAERDRKTPSYLIGARIDEIKMSVCDHATLTLKHAYSRNMQSGKASIKIDWQIFDVLKRKVVYETKTEGYYRTKQGSPDGLTVILSEAFGSAAANLAADRKFYNLASKPKPSIADIRTVDKIRLLIKRRKLFQDPITKNIDLVRLGVVTIDTGLSHGSGVFISPQKILTNYHVVESKQIVRVTLITGRKVLGEVVRSHRQRDVALVHIEKGGYRPLGIRMDPLKITEEVYAIGSPVDRDQYAGTVTKGIVSKYRRNRYGLEDIQADVDIQGGSSGGALLDAKGNLVGLTYAGIGPGKRSVGINFFIPIADALRFLNIDFKGKAR